MSAFLVIYWYKKAPACMIATQARAVKKLFDPEGKIEIKTIGIPQGEKMYETLLTNEECAHAIDLGNFYRVPCDKCDLNTIVYPTSSVRGVIPADSIFKSQENIVERKQCNELCILPFRF